MEQMRQNETGALTAQAIPQKDVDCLLYTSVK